MQIRRMTENDLGIITHLEQLLFEDPWQRKSFEFELNRNRYSICLVLEDKGRIIGYAIVWKIYEEFHIANFAIHPDFQGQKLGTYFLEQLLQYSGNARYALLEVRESNLPARHLYKKFGFKTIMKRHYYYRNGETALVMQKIFEKKKTGT